MSKPKGNNKSHVLSELERQLERSGFFTHSSLSHQAKRINEIESFLYGLIDTLISQNAVDKNLLEKAVGQVRDETLQKKEHFHPGIALSLGSNEKPEGFVPINCEERLPVCKAVCCKLNFALSVEEIESGKAKWDLGQPYFIRHKENGACIHLDAKKQCCSIYDDRPKVCQNYSCAKDKRIWADFEKMELNHEWIKENLKERRIQLQEAYMVPEDKIEYKTKVE